jgi:hypothetical protein
MAQTLGVRVNIEGVTRSGTYSVHQGSLTVQFGNDTLRVDFGAGDPVPRAQEMLETLVKRARNKR